MNRFVRYPLLATAASIAAFAFATSALATIMSPTYTTDPNAVSPTDGRPLGATATFIYDDACTSNCSLTIVLANTEDMTGVSQGLTDFHFTSTSLTNLAQDGADGDQWADCDNAPKGSNFCTFSDAAFDQNSYGWTLGGSYVLAATPLTDAGIVKTPIDPNSDGVGNVQHNPWLVGPVDFFFTYDGSFSVGNVAFSFGTDASSPTVPVARPSAAKAIAAIRTCPNRRRSPSSPQRPSQSSRAAATHETDLPSVGPVGGAVAGPLFF